MADKKVTREELVNKHIIIRDEMARRRMRHAETPRDELDELTCEIAGPAQKSWDLPERVTVVPDYVSMVGSAVYDDDPQDVDIVVRSDIVDGQLGIQSDNVLIPLRKVLDPDKSGYLHFVPSPQGPHDDYKVLYDLALVKSDAELREIKSLAKLLRKLYNSTQSTLKIGRRVRRSRVRQVEELLQNLRELESDLVEFLEWAQYDKSISILKDSDLELEFVGTGAMNTAERRGASLLITWGGHRVQIDGEIDDDIQDDLDELLVTDPEAWNAEAAVDAGGHVGEYSAAGVSIVPYEVEHTSHDVYGYLITQDDKRVGYIPECWNWPAWAEDLDLAIVDGSAWERDIRFTGGVGGHRSVLTLAKEARKHDVERVVATHVGNPTQDALENREHVGMDIEFPRDGETVEVKAVTPGSKYPLVKPRMAGTTDTYSVDELYDAWVKDRLGEKLYGSPKIDGFRSVVSWDGEQSTIYFEEAKEAREPSNMPETFDAPSFVVEGEFTAQKGGDWLARTQLMGVAQGDIDATPHFWLYDILYYDGEDVSGEDFEDRLETLRKVGGDLPSEHFTVLAQRSVTNRRQLDKVAKWAFDRPLSEGLYIREADAPYQFGATSSAAKIKKVLELKVEVLDVIRTENGYTYRCGLEGDDFENTTDGYIDLGKTFVTKTKQADEGETLDVEVEELVILEDGELAWGKPKVSGPASRPAYTAGQAVNMARRAGLLKEEASVKSTISSLKANDESELGGELTRGERAKRFWEKNWYKLIAQGEGPFVLHGHFPAVEEEHEGKSLDQLLDLGLGYHTDIRHDAPNPWGAWGFTGYEGESEDVPSQGTNLYEIDPDSALQGSFKLENPESWLDVGKRGPYWSESVGRTGKDWAVFFALDWGNYKLTFARKHAFEIIYDGEKGVLDGRYQINFVPIGGERKWLISRPENQDEIYADTHKLESVVKELRSKGQEWLFWRESKDSPLEKIDVSEWESEKMYLDDDLTKAEVSEIGRMVKEAYDLHGRLMEALDGCEQRAVYSTIETLDDTIIKVKDTGAYGYAYPYAYQYGYRHGYGHPKPTAVGAESIVETLGQAIEALDREEPQFEQAIEYIEDVLDSLGYAKAAGDGALIEKLRGIIESLDTKEPDYEGLAKKLARVLEDVRDRSGYPEPKSFDFDEKIPETLRTPNVKIYSEDEDRVRTGGYLVKWGAPDETDLAGDYFTPDTDMELVKSVPLMFHHGLDDELGPAILGRRVKAVEDDIGLWVEHWLDKSREYWKMVEPLLKASVLYLSPGTAAHLTEREEDGELKMFRVVEDSLTATPCQYRLEPVERIKAGYEQAGLEFPIDDEDDDQNTGELESLMTEIDEELDKLGALDEH